MSVTATQTQTMTQRSTAHQPPTKNSVVGNIAVGDLGNHAANALKTVRGRVRAISKVDVNEPTIMPKEYYTRCYQSSFLALSSISVAFAYGHFFLGSLGLAVFLTSINYWRHPSLGLRRLIDMGVVATALSIHLYHCTAILNQVHGPLYIFLCAVGVTFYLKSRHCGLLGDYHGDSLFHVGLHVMGNISNIVLYIGLGSGA